MKFSYSAKVFQRTDAIKKNGTATLYLRVIINRKPVWISLGLAVKPEEFNDDNCTVKIKDDPKLAEDYTLILKQCLSKANNIFVRYRLMEKELTTDIFKKMYKKPVYKFTFNDFVEKETEELKKVVAPGTIKNYKKFTRHLNKYNSEVQFGDINKSFAEDFNRFLIKEKLSHNYRIQQLKVCKKFINLASSRQIDITDPFEKIGSYMEGDRTPLDREELVALYDVYKSRCVTDRERNVAQCFLASCFLGGMRFQDISALTSNEIHEDHVIFVPKKTKRFNRIVKIPITATAREFIDITKNKTFKTISNTKTNQTLKILAARAGIKKHLNFHVARHTFATLFLELGGSQEVLMEIMGVSNHKTIKTYIHIAAKRKKEQMQKMDLIIPELGFQYPATA